MTLFAITASERDLVAVQPDNKVLLAGSNLGDTRGFCLLRLDAGGNEDRTFSGGKVCTDVPPGVTSNVKDIALQPDGKILLGGVSGQPTSFALARFLADGQIDAGF